ncbi:MAG TPA: hypothetical protein PKA53_03365 [Sphingobacterium sp.]|nr:hypothetical protein [Sphingobacterium sp.]
MNCFFSTVLCLACVLVTIGLEIKKDREFNKPSLLNIFYDGSYNGRGIDFKMDGRYILDEMAIGFIDYSYGTYTISNNKITLNPPYKKGSQDIISHMLILGGEEGSGLFAVETDSLGNILNERIKYRVTVDNRGK